jgi:hypothetical protein
VGITARARPVRTGDLVAVLDAAGNELARGSGELRRTTSHACRQRSAAIDGILGFSYGDG